MALADQLAARVAGRKTEPPLKATREQIRDIISSVAEHAYGHVPEYVSTWVEELLSLPTEHTQSALRNDIPAIFAEPPRKGAEPDDHDAIAAGFQRVVFAGVDSAPIFGLLRTQPEANVRHKLTVFLPSFLAPANSASMLHRGYWHSKVKKEHVLILDSRGSGWTGWWSPQAPMTGGWLEGLDLALVIEDLVSDLDRRVSEIHLQGFIFGGTVALWCAYQYAMNRPEQRATQDPGLRWAPRVRYVDTYNAPTHIGSVLRSLQPREGETGQAASCWRAFFRLLFDVQKKRSGKCWPDARDFREYFLSAGVDPADLLLPPSSQPRETDSYFPGDLLPVAPILAESGARISLRSSLPDRYPSVASEQASRLQLVVGKGARVNSSNDTRSVPPRDLKDSNLLSFEEWRKRRI